MATGSNPRHRVTVRSCRAFTLLETLLVLALFVIMAALAWPALEQPLAGQRLRRAADQVRAHWVRARNKAMLSGETYSFRYLPGSGESRLERSATSASGPQAASAGGTQAGAGHQGAAAAEEDLPEGIIFLPAPGEAQPRGGVDMVQPSSAADGLWSPPILFYPDGTATTARVVLKGQGDRHIAVQLRGLTGVTNVGEVFEAGDMAQ